jgi:predicted RNase H-like HicB family nuclease
MIAYRAMFKFLDDGVHAEVLDFPGVITSGRDVDEARRLLRSALSDMAETSLQLGEALPRPNPAATDPESDLEEPIYLLIQAATHVVEVPQDAFP